MNIEFGKSSSEPRWQTLQSLPNCVLLERKNTPNAVYCKDYSGDRVISFTTAGRVYTYELNGYSAEFRVIPSGRVILAND